MDDKPREVVRYRYRYRRFGCGGGFFLVLTVGIVMALFNLAVGVGISVRVPFTSANFTIAASIGQKDKAVAALPSYTEGRLGGNQNVFNNSTTMTIGPAEGAAEVILGRQDGAPVFDLHLDVR
ncbi:MAG: hypothetical protein E6I42_01460 [Chloroflexi bacterium]|nr:MAG: hypothetical protein E6J30_08380 [Chloroflexota bacterium]TMD80134.1 MAG: hypothetical protein E6I77_02010 [Chloroflexota bacterium]TMF06858.1 MAG: hypothetical protein E6I42_01460 [Chloroflexota bacterium]TMG30866.1 MAG: hypothetical protein E6H97_00620 [Chloroflexota bacterium]